MSQHDPGIPTIQGGEEVNLPVLVCGRCMTDEDRPFSIGTTTRQGLCTRCNGQGVWLLDGAVDEPRLRERRESEVFSTSCALLPYPPVIWDVNGYYRALGVKPDATRAELRQAYQRLDGHGDDRLTYILTRLLNPETRARYDECALGDVFMDRWVMDRLLEQARQQAADAVASKAVTLDDLDDLSGWADFLDVPLSELDKPSCRDDDVLTGRQWGYFLWRSVHSDDESLDHWQSLLIDALWSSGFVGRVGVGFSKGCGPWAIQQVGEATVIFLDEDREPTAEHASLVASHIRTKGKMSPS